MKNRAVLGVELLILFTGLWMSGCAGSFQNVGGHSDAEEYELIVQGQLLVMNGREPECQGLELEVAYPDGPSVTLSIPDSNVAQQGSSCMFTLGRSDGEFDSNSHAEKALLAKQFPEVLTYLSRRASSQQMILPEVRIRYARSWTDKFTSGGGRAERSTTVNGKRTVRKALIVYPIGPVK